MINNIHEDLLHLAIDIDTIEFLDGNPRHGDEDAIGASYEEFQQLKPIVVHVGDDGKVTVVAGNHQLKGARKREWTKIAAIKIKGDLEQALKFALTDNRTSELGTTDTDLTYEMLSQVMDGNEDYFDGLGWDDFELVAMEPVIVEPHEANPQIGWEPPALIERTEDEDGNEDLHFTGTEEEEKALVLEGSPAAGISGKANAVIQYTLVFDDAQQNGTWYNFLSWMKAQPDLYKGQTTSEQLINFLLSTNYGDEDDQ